jgi:hypothetical protein
MFFYDSPQSESETQLIYNFKRVVMAKRSRQPNDKETIAKALALIDPEKTLVQGTREHDRISDLIRCWIDECGQDYALCMARKGAKHLDRWRKFL